MRSVDKDVLGDVTKRTTPDIYIGGGNEYKQAGVAGGFKLVKPRQGHSMKANLRS
jgi:hypothetical protein